MIPFDIDRAMYFLQSIEIMGNALFQVELEKLVTFMVTQEVCWRSALKPNIFWTPDIVNTVGTRNTKGIQILDGP